MFQFDDDATTQKFKIKKKSKKRPLISQEDTFMNEYLQEMQETQISKKPKKKLRDFDIEEEEVEVFVPPYTSPKKKKRNKINDTEHIEPSKSRNPPEKVPKKGKVNQHDHSIKMDETIFNFVEPDGDMWSLEEDSKLLSSVFESFPPCTKSFRIRLREDSFKKQFQEIVTNLQSSRSMKECLDRLGNLFSRVNSTKSLRQIVQDCLDDLPNIRNIKLTTPYQKFKNDHTEAIQNHMQENDLSKEEAANFLWENLDPNLRAKYRKNSSIVTKGSPFQIYYAAYKKKHPSLAGKKHALMEVKKSYKNLKPAKVVKYVEKYIKNAISEESDNLEAQVESLNMTKREIEIYLNHLGMPEIPLSSRMTLFKERGLQASGLDVMKLANQEFNKFTPEEREAWDSKYEQNLADFKCQYKEWLSQQRPFIEVLINKNYKTLQALLKEPKNRLPKHKKIKENLFTTLEMPLSSSITFPGEPILPPVTIYSVFKYYYEKEHGTSNVAETKQQFKEMNPEFLKKIKDRTAKLKEKAKKAMFEFVLGLEKEQQKLFLGMRRFKYFKLFNEDIFSEEFPHTEYPLFVKPKKSKVEKKEAKGQYKFLELSLAEESEEESDSHYFAASPPKRPIKDCFSASEEEVSDNAKSLSPKKKKKKSHKKEPEEEEYADLTWDQAFA